MVKKKMDEITEEDLDRKLEMLVDSMPEQKEFEKKIDRYIKKKIQRITIKTVLAFLTVAAVLFIMISPATDAVYLNPKKLQKDETYVSVMRDYYDITRPYVEIGGVDVQKKGFGRYELVIQAQNNIHGRDYGIENVWVDVNQGKYENWKDPGRLLVNVMGYFSYSTTEEEKEKMIHEFEKLPESAEITLAILDKQVREVKELRKEKVTLDWIEVYHPNKPEFQGGINLWRALLFKESDDRDEMTEEELLKVYVENLENLAEHPEIWRDLGLPYRSILWPDGETVLKECLEDARTLKDLKTTAYYVTGGRDDIVEYLKKIEADSISIYKVKSNMWE